MRFTQVPAAFLCCALACGPALGQSAQSAAPPASTPAADAVVPPANVVPKGTLVTVEIMEPLSAATAKSGDQFTIRLAEPICVNGVVLVPAGVKGEGEVIDAKPANIGGRPGRLILAAHYLVSGPVRLGLQSFKLGGGGRDNSGLAVGATVVVGLAGVLVTGGNIEYPAGARATAKIAADVTVAPFPPAAPVAAAADALAAPASPSS